MSHFLQNSPSSTLQASYTCNDDTSSNILVSLASHKNCGHLMLINKLLNSEDSTASRLRHKMNCYKLAAQLLANIKRTKITINPSLNENRMAFITSIIQQARQFALNSIESPLLPLANRLNEALEKCQMSDASKHLSMLEQYWNEFTYHFFKYKLQQLQKD